jgi:predicted RNA-binding protein with PUA-like domain
MALWILKSEPEEYSFARLAKDKRTAWTGIKNPVARKNLATMRAGDRALFYHTGKEKAVVGIAEVVSADGENVEISAVGALRAPVPLSVLKSKAVTKKISVVRMGRLSVGALTKSEWDAVIKLSEAK